MKREVQTLLDLLRKVDGIGGPVEDLVQQNLTVLYNAVAEWATQASAGKAHVDEIQGSMTRKNVRLRDGIRAWQDAKKKS